MRRPANMPEHCPCREQQIGGANTRGRGVRDPLLMLMVLVCLTRYGDARADGDELDGKKIAISDFSGGLERLTAAMSATNNAYRGYALEPRCDDSWPTDFRPRGHSDLEREVAAPTPTDVPMLKGTTVWQRLEDFRAHGRVRLLTLWENGGSAVSLQAGKKGEPSLQWTSRSMNRGGATRGVLDRLFSVSVAGANPTIRGASRPTNVEATSKSSKFAENATAEIK